MLNITSFLFRFLALGILLLPAATCGQRPSNKKPMQKYQTEKFLLTAGPCAADGYTATIQGGQFLGSDGTGFAVPGGHVLDGSWIGSGTTWSSGDDMHPAPERLNLTWFAYAEDKFYKGEFLLPQEKIYQLLKQGSWDIEKKKQGTYNRFIVCVLPKGGVVVWLSGGNKTVIGRYQAQEFIPSPQQFQRYYGHVDRTLMLQKMQARMPAEVQAEIKAGTLSTKKWEEYLKTYPWKVELSQPLLLYKYSVNLVNAEYMNNPLTREGMEAYRNVLLQPSAKALPVKLSLYGQAPHKARYLVRAQHFDQAELRAAVEQLLKQDATSPLTFYFAIDKPYQKATLSLKNQWKEIPLTKVTVEVLNEK
jgi:hypothetical protein